MNKFFCTNCGNEINENSSFCAKCGTKVKKASAASEPEVKQAEKYVSTVMKTIAAGVADGTQHASATGGQMVFINNAGISAEFLTESTAPLKFILNTIGGLFGNIKSSLKDKKQLISLIVISIVWLVLMILNMFGINSDVLNFLNFLTFAKGGTSGGVMGIIGGIIGKGIFSYFVFSLLIPVFSKKKPFDGIGKGVKQLFTSFSAKNNKKFVSLFFGMGAALIAYNFLVGSASLQNSMAGIAAFLLSLQALSSKAGFLRGFINSFQRKFSKGTVLDVSLVNRIIAGWSMGFILAVLLSVPGIGILPYLTGILCIITGIVIHFAVKGKGAV